MPLQHDSPLPDRALSTEVMLAQTHSMSYDTSMSSCTHETVANFLCRFQLLHQTEWERRHANIAPSLSMVEVLCAAKMGALCLR